MCWSMLGETQKRWECEDGKRVASFAAASNLPRDWMFNPPHQLHQIIGHDNSMLSIASLAAFLRFQLHRWVAVSS
ncbi:bifunctional tRNA [Sesbania bispinosa]|nr:bifunctional tRNA [Sesbania bispinosa]